MRCRQRSRRSPAHPLHRCLQRHGISRLPEIDGDRPVKKQKFKSYPIGYFHVDIAEVRTEEGKLRLLVARDRTSKFVYASCTRRQARWKPLSSCAT